MGARAWASPGAGDAVLGVLNEHPEEGPPGQGSREPGRSAGVGLEALPQAQACPRMAPGSTCVVSVNRMLLSSRPHPSRRPTEGWGGGRF